MITYRSCLEIPVSEIYEAFCLSFSDYFFPLSMKEEEFKTRFFGPEGNKLEYSYVAYEDTHPIGFLLGGIRLFDFTKTMRCGILGLSPQYRGRGISQGLFALHKEAAVREGCKQLFLEVITENTRAVAFYKKLGYREAAILKYYSCPVTALPALKATPACEIKELSFEQIKNCRDSLKSCHINWQSDTPYYEDSKTDVFLGAYDGTEYVGMIALTQTGKINFLWVEPEYRHKGIGHLLLTEAVKHTGAEKLSVCIPGNALLEGFFRKLDFQKDKLEQYEMYLPL